MESRKGGDTHVEKLEIQRNQHFGPVTSQGRALKSVPETWSVATGYSRLGLHSTEVYDVTVIFIIILRRSK